MVRVTPPSLFAWFLGWIAWLRGCGGGDGRGCDVHGGCGCGVDVGTAETCAIRDNNGCMSAAQRLGAEEQQTK